MHRSPAPWPVPCRGGEAVGSHSLAADGLVAGRPVPDDGPMKFSTRNQLPGTVVSVTAGEAMAVVRIQLDEGGLLTSSITRDAVEDLGLAEGSKVVALVKSTEVSLAVE